MISFDKKYSTNIINLESNSNKKNPAELKQDFLYFITIIYLCNFINSVTLSNM